MSKKVILADGGYTIRRIVELSFEGEEDYELITMDNGAELKEKLEVIKPQVVIVDVNLPDVNGYDICEYINTNENLKNINVILLKGSFEPVDENRISKLKYEEIIQKPFESNQFMETVKRVADKFTIPEPPSLPEEEDISNIDFNDSEDISFSDVKEELQKEDVNIDVNPDELTEDNADNNDVMPSEEITQGSLSEHEDKLIEENVDDVPINPFSEEKAEEKTVDDNNIVQENFSTVYKNNNADIIKDKDVGIENVSENIVTEEKVEEKIQENTNVEENLIEKDTIDEEISKEDGEIKEEPVVDRIEEEKSVEVPYEFGSSEDLSNEDTKQEIGKKDLLMETQDEDTFNKMDFISEEKNEIHEREILKTEEEKIKESSNQRVNTTVTESNLANELVEEDFSESIKDTQEKHEEIKDENVDKLNEIVSEEISEEKIDETFNVDTKKDIVSEEKEKTEEVITKFGDEISKEEVLNRIKGKLTDVVKEILWEVLPPIAEKIVKEEIERIREELSKLQ